MEKYFNILEEMHKEKISIVRLYILSSISINEEVNEENKKIKWEMVEYIYEIWAETEVNTSLDRLIDTVVVNWHKIKVNEMTQKQIIDLCEEF